MGMINTYWDVKCYMGEVLRDPEQPFLAELQ